MGADNTVVGGRAFRISLLKKENKKKEKSPKLLLFLNILSLIEPVDENDGGGGTRTKSPNYDVAKESRME